MMRLQTKTSLAILPMVSLATLFLGTWSVITSTQSLRKSMEFVMTLELDDFMDHSLKRMYGVLEKNRLTQVGSFVKKYQELALVEAKAFHYLQSSRLVILGPSGRAIFSSKHGLNHADPLWRDVATRISSQPDGEIKGELKTSQGKEIYVGRYFKPWSWSVIYAISASEVTASARSIRNATFGIAALCIVVGFFLIFLIFRSFLITPVSRLKDAAKSIAGQEDVDRIDIRSRDELGELARSMEEMAGAIQSYRTRQANWQNHLEEEIQARTQDLNETNAALTEEIRVRKKTEEELRETLEFNQKLISASPLAIVAYDATGQCMHANRSTARIIGTTRERVMEQNYNRIDSWKRTGLLAAAQVVIADGADRHLESHMVSTFGREIWIECYLSRFSSGGQAHLLLMINDVTQRKELEARLKKQKEALERSNRELDDFAYVASHDLKEPLRGIANYSGFLMEDYGKILDDEGRSKLKTLIRLASREESLIESLLEYSRVGRTELAFERVDLNAVVREVTGAIMPSFEGQNVHIRVPEPLPVIWCDSVRINEVFCNLFTNAIKYNDKAEKWIETGVNPAVPGEAAGHYIFYVKDNGIGIPEKHHKKIFTIFKRLHGRDKFGGGTGAGLTIVKKIVERHGGKIWVESRPGEGTTFYFTLKQGEYHGQVQPTDPDC
jgi:PAS domain S-box-containing protein